jgi:hypothetical protein
MQSKFCRRHSPIIQELGRNPEFVARHHHRHPHCGTVDRWCKQASYPCAATAFAFERDGCSPCGIRSAPHPSWCCAGGALCNPRSCASALCGRAPVGIRTDHGRCTAHRAFIKARNVVLVGRAGSDLADDIWRTSTLMLN